MAVQQGDRCEPAGVMQSLYRQRRQGWNICVHMWHLRRQRPGCTGCAHTPGRVPAGTLLLQLCTVALPSIVKSTIPQHAVCTRTGSGIMIGTPASTCGTCGGSNQVVQALRIPLGVFQQVRSCCSYALFALPSFVKSITSSLPSLLAA